MSPNEGHENKAAATVAQELTGLIEEIEEYVEEKVAPILETFDQDGASASAPAPGPNHSPDP